LANRKAPSRVLLTDLSKKLIIHKTRTMRKLAEALLATLIAKESVVKKASQKLIPTSVTLKELY
jgi:hypothetical protein